jgi:hypothetical protein
MPGIAVVLLDGWGRAAKEQGTLKVIVSSFRFQVRFVCEWNSELETETRNCFSGSELETRNSKVSSRQAA